jgi:ArsR family transcriptional regulator, cadmium/lead-responsive transcriptional repressor
MSKSWRVRARVGQHHPLGLKAKLFRGLSDSSRLGILESLRQGPRSVTEVVEVTGRAQSNVSNHLNCLLDCGLVQRDQQGRFAFYSLADRRVSLLLETAESFLADVTKGLYECTRYSAPTLHPLNKK